MEWRELQEFPNYEVSDSGLVRAKPRQVPCTGGSTRGVGGHVLAQMYNEQGYLSVNLIQGTYENTRQKVHRLVAIAFLGPPLEGQTDVNHLNGQKDDNSRTNLEWCTRSENLQHYYRELGGVSPTKGKFDALHHNSIPIEGVDPLTGQVVKSYASLSGAGRDGYNTSHVSACINGDRKIHKGLSWRKA